MGTRSTIAVEHLDGTVSQVYCHWDGYLSHNGQLLITHYDTLAKAEQLVRFGDMSSLREKCIPDPERPHTFDVSQEDVTVYYGRDRLETGIAAKKYTSLTDYKENFNPEEYNYLFTEGQWEVASAGDYELVTAAMEAEELQAEE